MSKDKRTQDAVNEAWAELKGELDRTAVISESFKGRLIVLANSIAMATYEHGRSEGARQMQLDLKEKAR
jgi:hypothetical protein